MGFVNSYFFCLYLKRKQSTSVAISRQQQLTTHRSKRGSRNSNLTSLSMYSRVHRIRTQRTKDQNIGLQELVSSSYISRKKRINQSRHLAATTFGLDMARSRVPLNSNFTSFNIIKTM